MIAAVMDIGSNTSLLLIARLGLKKSPDILEDRIFFTRLAEGMSKQKIIKAESLRRQKLFFEQARRIIDQHSVEKIKCVATAAARKARNAHQLVCLARRYGFFLDIISEEEEAKRSRQGALFHLPVPPESSVVLDIGGASSEISTPHEFFSLPIGSVSLTERFIQKDPPAKREIFLLMNEIKKEISAIPFCFSKDSVLVATAGTPATLAALENKTDKLHDLHGEKLSRKQVCLWWEHLFGLSFQERKKLQGMPLYRADVMPAGLSILKELMYQFQWNECIVSITGLRYGLLCQFEMN